MRNRPLWQILGTIFVFAPLQHYLQNPNTFFTLDSLIGMRQWLFWAVALSVVLFILEKSGKHGRALAEVLAVAKDSTDHVSRKNWLWLMAGFVFLVCILGWLEQHRSFFFTQDDNLMQFLPVILQGCHSLMSGVFPTWNPYQLLGAPTTSIGVYALTYPITYVSYLFSRLVLHNEFLTIEVYCIFHIVGGYFAFYWAARCYRIRAAIAAIAALCTVLSGWLLIASPSWFYVSPIFLYMPLIIVGIAKLERGTGGWKWIIAMAVVVGLFFHAGNVQFWVYGMLFLWMALLILKWAGQISWGKILSSLAATLLGIALVCPLLIPQFLQTRAASRIMNPDSGQVTGQWQAFLLPAPWVHADAPADTTDPAWKTGGLALYSGTTFVLLAIPLVACFVFYRFIRETIGRNVWLVCGVIAFLACLGRAGIVWPIMLHLPLLSKFRIPFKFLAFFNIFVVLAGAMVLERLLQRTRWYRKLELGIATVTASLLAAACMMPLPTWYSYHLKPYPSAESMLTQMPDAKMNLQRIMSLALYRSPSPRYWQGMPHNLPTVYQVPALLGYDPLVDASPAFLRVKERLQMQLLQSLHEYGVEYVLIAKDFEHPRLSGYSLVGPMEWLSPVPRSEVPEVLAAGELVFHDEEVSIIRLPKAKPLAFAENTPTATLPLKFQANGFDLEATSLSNGGRVIANFLWYPEMRAEADGRPVRVVADSWQRIGIDIPEGAKKIKVRFVPEWGKGFLCALFAALGGTACGFFALRISSAGIAARTVSQ